MNPKLPISSIPISPNFKIPLPPTGPHLTTKGWHQEAAKRCLLNNLHPQVAEDRDQLIVYGGRGKAARNIESLQRILWCLDHIENHETLLIQSGEAVGILPTHHLAPRVLIANSNLVPHWANWEHFNHLEKEGLMMYGQMTAGSWIYIGSQGIVQGTYETFMAACRLHYPEAKNLQSKLIISAGLGGMGGAQPLAVKLAGGVFIGAEVDPSRIQKRLESGYVDILAKNLEEAFQLAQEAQKKAQALSIAININALDLLEYCVQKSITPDLTTDQTSAHDPLYGYIPQGWNLSDSNDLRKNDPQRYEQLSLESMKKHVALLLTLKSRGSHVFDYGNNLREGAYRQGLKEAFEIPGFVKAYIRPLFCQGSGPFRFIALSGNSQDIFKIDEELRKLFPEDIHLQHWLDMAKKHISFQGLPARICWLNYWQRAKAGLMINHLVKEGILEAPIAIGRDHLDCGSVASPFRETEGMLDGSDAISDWPILNLLINSVGGASWTSFHHGGGVGIGYSQHAGMVIVADGSEEMNQRLNGVLNSDPAMGIIRHAHSGEPLAQQAAQKTTLKIPFLNLPTSAL